MDEIDQKILEELRQDSSLTNKEIGEKIHLTGQAVGNRISKLQESGAIRRYTIEVTYEHTQFIRVFMNTNNFQPFEQFANSFKEVSSIYKVSGQACYMLVAHFTEKPLKDFIEALSKWARYSVEVVIADKTDKHK